MGQVFSTLSPSFRTNTKTIPFGAGMVSVLLRRLSKWKCKCKWVQRTDSNRQPPGYGPGELPLLYSAMGAGWWQDIRQKGNKMTSVLYSEVSSDIVGGEERQPRRKPFRASALISQYHFTTYKTNKTNKLC